MTYSLCGCDPERGEWGVAVQSKFLAVGAAVPSAEAGAGALASQAYANLEYGPRGLALLREGLGAEEVVERLVSSDEGREKRQVGVVDRHGRGATFTGAECVEWAGGRVGAGWAAQGNVLVSEATVDALGAAFEAGSALPLAWRLLEALAAGQAAGGDRRGQQSAALLVVRRGAGYGGAGDVAVDLRVDDHPAPVAELVRLHGLHELYFGETPQEQWVPVDDALAHELRHRLAELGYATGDLPRDLEAWAGFENLEERVAGAEAVDPVVLGALREGLPR